MNICTNHNTCAVGLLSFSATILIALVLILGAFSFVILLHLVTGQDDAYATTALHATGMTRASVRDLGGCILRTNHSMMMFVKATAND